MGDTVTVRYPNNAEITATLPGGCTQQTINESSISQNEKENISKYLEIFSSFPEEDEEAKIDPKQLEASLNDNDIPDDKKDDFKRNPEYTKNATKKENLNDINTFLQNVNNISKQILSLLVLHSKLSIEFKSKETSINITEKFKGIINLINFETTLQGQGEDNFKIIENKAKDTGTDKQNLLNILIKQAEKLVESIGTKFSEKEDDIKEFVQNFTIETDTYIINQGTLGKPTDIIDKVKEYKNEIGQMKSNVTENVKLLVDALNAIKPTKEPEATAAAAAPAAEEEEDGSSSSDSVEDTAIPTEAEAAEQERIRQEEEEQAAQAAEAEAAAQREGEDTVAQDERVTATTGVPTAVAAPTDAESVQSRTGGAIGFSNKYDLLQIKNAIDKTLFNESSTNLQTQIPVQVRRNTQYGGSIDQLNLKKISLRNNQLFAKFNDGSKLPINSNTFYKIQRGGYNNNLSNTSTEISLCE